MTQQPLNIVFITTHDSGRHFGCYGVESAPTPHIDKLAAEGIQFDRMFSVCSICSPSRAAMMTGYYPQRTGVMGLAHEPYNWRLNAGIRHLSHHTRQAGYQNALIGHFHETMEPARDLAFDHISHYTTEEKQSFLPYTSAAQVAGGVEDWLKEGRDPRRPFFLQIGFFETHTPFHHGVAEPHRENGVTVPEPVVENEESRQHFAELQGALKQLDDAMGRILAALDAEQLRESTLVVFTTDHGVDIAPYFRFKHSLYDRGIEVAYLMRLPGVIEPGTTSQALLSNLDSLPTALDLVGLPVLEDLDGRSFAGIFRGEPANRDTVFAELTNAVQNSHIRCARTERHKLILNFAARRAPSAPVDMGRPPKGPFPPNVELYDLLEDPYETRNLADDPAHAATLEDMKQRLKIWLQDCGDPILQGPVPTPYYLEGRKLLS